jgi:hypothetical protein
MSIENLNSAVHPIGKLACQLAILERIKGQRKLIEAEEKEAKAPFLAQAGESACVWISESGQKLASVQWQARESFSRDSLLAAGVTVEQLQAATSRSSFPVLRIH